MPAQAPIDTVDVPIRPETGDIKVVTKPRGVRRNTHNLSDYAIQGGS